MKKLLTLCMIGISVAFGQLDQRDIILIQIDSMSLQFIGEGEKVKFRPVTEQEAERAKNAAIRYIEDKVSAPESYLRLRYRYEKYTKQYVGFTDENGNEFIYINGFCSEYSNIDDLRENLLIVFDGGNCFFRIKIDLKTGKCVSFSIHGVA